jgi:heat shock protein HslJ
MKTKILSLILLAVLAASCKSTEQKNPDKNQEQSETSADFDQSITNKYWKLVKLEGQEVKMAENQERERYFKLKTEENRVQGFSGCNTFSGSYTLEKGMRIGFSQMASTMKACPDVNVDESAFLKVFELTDNYTINDDTLRLNVGRRAPLAVFEAVYFD